MIHYHGGPITPVDAAVTLWTRRHAFVAFASRSQTPLAFEVCQSVAADCSAAAKAGMTPIEWCRAQLTERAS